MKVEVNLELRVLQVGDFIYSLDILVDGFETPKGQVCTITKSEPAPNGTRTMLFHLKDEQA
ncbi:hypothetical protein [Sphingomonas sp. ERG5]|uniref:hypothetical protein n=1 Tax=Sphingomonas sp. ERG5 TaxID=1381597 RepID=UPI00054BE9A7|nr:hypothetical protein [Sphingomonas sp. ERG5]